MAGYTTIGDLIRYLGEEDPSEPVIYQYYLAEHFDIDTEQFSRAAEALDSLIPCLDNSRIAIEEEIERVKS